MADTALRPRPAFGTFLRSDTNAGGDSLSFYEYKKLLRAKKVSLLQERRAASYEPGYKRVMPQSRQVYQKDEGTSVPGKVEAHTQTEMTAAGLPDKAAKVHHVTLSLEEKAPVLKTTSQVLSARAHSRSSTWPDLGAADRPSTAGTRGYSHRISDPQLAASRQLSSLSKPSAPAQKLWVQKQQEPQAAAESVAKEDTDRPPSRISVRDVPAVATDTSTSKPDPTDVQALVNSYCWTSATQKSYSDVKWENKLPASLPTPDPATTLCCRPDSVSLKLAVKRMEIQPQNWQNLGSAWDFVQTRQGCYYRPRNKNLFCSPCRNSQHIPGYLGHIPGAGRVERAEGDYKATTQILVAQPRPTRISRRANIPGYSGCTHWSNMYPAHAVMPPPYSTTQFRVHREVPVDDDPTPFQRTGVMSKMVTLTAPYNPFNRIQA